LFLQNGRVCFDLLFCLGFVVSAGRGKKVKKGWFFRLFWCVLLFNELYFPINVISVKMFF